METPLVDALRAINGRAWLHMPGHGGNLDAVLDARMDVTEIPASDDLYDPLPGGPFEQAQALAAEACGAGATLFVTGGSTQGIHAMLAAFVPPGGKVILPRNAHRSAIAACAVCDLRPVYVWPRVQRHFATVWPPDIVEAIARHPDASAVLVTRPDYFGVCPDLTPVAEAAHAQGISLLIDEAHGAHFPYGGDVRSASAYGADAWVQSAHKTLPALTQAAYLHLKDASDMPSARHWMALLGTSSPSFLIAASLDSARAWMRKDGASWIRAAYRRNSELIGRVSRLGIQDAQREWRAMGFECDPARIVLDVSSMGWSGYHVLRELSRRGVDVEMADCYRIVALPPLTGDGQALHRLASALAEIPRGSDPHVLPELALPRARAAATPREAMFAKTTRVPLDRAVGRVSAGAVGLYPPGVPLLMPGERISDALVDFIFQMMPFGARAFGTDEMNRVAVCENPAT